MRMKIAAIVIILSVFLIGCNRDDAVPAELPADSSAELLVSPEEAGEPVVADLTQSLSSLELIEYYVRVLTSEEFAGRMPGTPGNDLAVAWLSGRLTELGVEPYAEDGFQVGFTGWSNTFIRSDMIVISDGATRVLEQGTDFFISLGEGSFSVALESGGDNFAVVPIGGSRGPRILDPSAEYFVYFVNNGSFWNSAGAQATDRTFRDKQVQLSDEIYEIIKTGDFARIAITNTISYERMELYHVVGRIRGTNPANAVVISAHFDHVGQGGATFFPGAFDNASGTAALLYIAQRLKEKSQTHAFDFDIIIAFFNSEEHVHNGRPLGSQYFVPIVLAGYENVWNINIDCVGSSYGEVFLTGGSGSSALREAFTDFAAEHGVAVDNGQVALSDNINFVALDAPSFNFLSGDFVTGAIAHTNLDTYDRLYFPQIVRVSNMIVEFLLQDGVSVFEADEPVTVPTSDAVGPVDIGLVGRFEEIISSLRAGERVSFYESIYRYFPVESIRLYSYYEAVELDERFSHIRNFGEAEFMFFSFVPGEDTPLLRYIHLWNGEEFDFSIRPILPKDIDSFIANMRAEVVEIAELDNYFALRSREGGLFQAFLYYDGLQAFVVMQGRFMAFASPVFDEITIGLTSEPRLSISDIDDYVEFIRSLQFDEFIEGWKKFTS